MIIKMSLKVASYNSLGFLKIYVTYIVPLLGKYVPKVVLLLRKKKGTTVLMLLNRKRDDQEHT